MDPTVQAPGQLIRRFKMIRENDNGTDRFVLLLDILDMNSNTFALTRVRFWALTPGIYSLNDQNAIRAEKNAMFPVGRYAPYFNSNTRVYEFKFIFTPDYPVAESIKIIVVMQNTYGQELVFSQGDPNLHVDLTEKNHPYFRQ